MKRNRVDADPSDSKQAIEAIVVWDEPRHVPDVVIQGTADDPNMVYRPSVELVEIKSTKDLEQSYEVRSRVLPVPPALPERVREHVTAMNSSLR